MRKEVRGDRRLIYEPEAQALKARLKQILQSRGIQMSREPLSQSDHLKDATFCWKKATKKGPVRMTLWKEATFQDIQKDVSSKRASSSKKRNASEAEAETEENASNNEAQPTAADLGEDKEAVDALMGLTGLGRGSPQQEGSSGVANGMKQSVALSSSLDQDRHSSNPLKKARLSVAASVDQFEDVEEPTSLVGGLQRSSPQRALPPPVIPDTLIPVQPTATTVKSLYASDVGNPRDIGMQSSFTPVSRWDRNRLSFGNGRSVGILTPYVAATQHMTVQSGTGPQNRNAAYAHNGNVTKMVAPSAVAPSAVAPSAVAPSAVAPSAVSNVVAVTHQINPLESQESAAIQVSPTGCDVTLKTAPPEAPTKVEQHESVMDYDVPMGYTREGTTGLQTWRTVRGDRRRIDENEVQVLKARHKEAVKRLVDVLDRDPAFLVQENNESMATHRWDRKNTNGTIKSSHWRHATVAEIQKDVNTKRSYKPKAAKFDGKLVDVISRARETLKQLRKEHDGDESYEGKLEDFGKMLEHFEKLVLREHNPQIDNYLETRDSCLILVVNRMYKELQKKSFDSVLSPPPGLGSDDEEEAHETRNHDRVVKAGVPDRSEFI